MAPLVAAPPQPARLSLTGTAWLIVLGALGVFISVFLTWATATVHAGFGVVETGTAHLTGAGRFAGIVVAVGVVALSSPVFAGGTVSRKRVIGLIVLLAIFTLLAGVWSASTGNSLHKASKESPDVGVFVCWTAILLIWIGVVRILRQRRSSAPSPSAR
jgi:hypothetical protein